MAQEKSHVWMKFSKQNCPMLIEIRSILFVFTENKINLKAFYSSEKKYKPYLEPIFQMKFHFW